MPGRDDSILYTGATSGAFATKREQPVRKALREAKEEKRIKLSSSGQIVQDELQKEIDKLRNLDYLELDKISTDEHFRAEMMARKKTLERLEAVKGRLANILRVPIELKPKPEPTSFE